mmetsp:Transcript_52202/g.151691  ORF Transcript_52202/g.151691 Transcript_52202/m.151691 type:complete len:202 (-) Transcript_52202:103-708(-)
MLWFESIAFNTAEAPCKTALWAWTSSSSFPLTVLTRMATSAETVSASALSQVATTPSGTAMEEAPPLGLERISTASSTAFSSSVQSASSCGSWCRSLMERLAASRHSKADLPAKLMGFMLSPPHSPPHQRETSHCRGATTCGSAPHFMAKRRRESLDFLSVWSAFIRSSKPLFSSFVSDSSSALTMSFPKRIACRGEPNTG